MSVDYAYAVDSRGKKGNCSCQRLLLHLHYTPKPMVLHAAMLQEFTIYVKPPPPAQPCLCSPSNVPQYPSQHEVHVFASNGDGKNRE
jgi:hypothetical protein